MTTWYLRENEEDGNWELTTNEGVVMVKMRGGDSNFREMLMTSIESFENAYDTYAACNYCSEDETWLIFAETS